MNETLTLHYAPDNASMIVRIALEMIGAPYRCTLVDRASRAQESQAYRALNPLGMIPALETGEGVIFETGAILLWLADRHGALFPAPDAQGRGDGLKWLFFVSNSLHAGLRQMFYPEKFIAPEQAEALRDGLAQRIHADFAQVERLVGDPETKCLGGAQMTVLDLYVCACFRWAQLYPTEYHGNWLKSEDFPELKALARKLEANPAAQHVQTAEGLGPTPFSTPSLPNPPIGSAT